MHTPTDSTVHKSSSILVRIDKQKAKRLFSYNNCNSREGINHQSATVGEEEEGGAAAKACDVPGSEA